MRSPIAVRLLIYSSILFYLVLGFSQLKQLESLAPVFGSLGAAAGALLAIWGLNELKAVKPYIENVCVFLAARRLILALFVVTVWLPGLSISALIVGCQIERYQYGQALDRVANDFRDGIYESGSLIRDIVLSYPDRREIWLLAQLKSANLRSRAEDIEFRAFGRFFLTAIMNERLDEENASEVHRILAGSDRRSYCFCTDDSRRFDPLISFARLAAEALATDPEIDGIKLARTIVDFAPRTSLRNLYVSMIDLDLVLSELQADIAADTAIRQRARARMEAVQTALTIVRRSEDTEAHDLYQQGWDFIGQYHLAECSLSDQLEASNEAAMTSIAQSFDELLKSRTKVGETRGWDTPNWTFPPEKFMLYWLVVDLSGLSVPNSTVREVLDDWKSGCPNSREVIGRITSAYEFSGPGYDSKWRQGTILTRELGPTSERYVLSDSLKTGWRF